MATPSRGAYGDSPYTPSGARSSSGTRAISGTGTRGGPGGPPAGGGGDPGGNPGGGSGGHPGGGHPGGGHGGGGHHGGGYHGWYCPPTYYGGSSWYWGGPWDWWWGWGPTWGWGWGMGGVYVIDDRTAATSQFARVDTDVSPEAAEVYLDGTLIGQADDFDGYPDYLYLETGKYRLEFRHPYYETVVKELDVRAGQAIDITDEMQLLPGKKKLEVVDPKDSGTPLGRVFGRPEAQKSASSGDRTGRFDVNAEPDGLGAPPPLPAGPDVGDSVPAERIRLRFDVDPVDAAVYLDDRYVGTGEELGSLRRGYPAKAGKHVVTVLRPGYQSKTLEVEAKPGTAIDVVVELEK